MLTVLFLSIILIILISNTTIKSGDKYTVDWWREKASLDSMGKTCARLSRLHRQGVVKKVSKNKNEIIRFIPISDFNEDEIIAMLQFLGVDKS